VRKDAIQISQSGCVLQLQRIYIYRQSSYVKENQTNFCLVTFHSDMSFMSCPNYVMCSSVGIC